MKKTTLLLTLAFLFCFYVNDCKSQATIQSFDVFYKQKPYRYSGLKATENNQTVRQLIIRVSGYAEKLSVDDDDFQEFGELIRKVADTVKMGAPENDFSLSYLTKSSKIMVSVSYKKRGLIRGGGWTITAVNKDDITIGTPKSLIILISYELEKFLESYKIACEKILKM